MWRNQLLVPCNLFSWPNTSPMANRQHHEALKRPTSGHSLNVGSLLLLIGGSLAVVAAVLARSGFTGRDHGK